MDRPFSHGLAVTVHSYRTAGCSNRINHRYHR